MAIMDLTTVIDGVPFTIKAEDFDFNSEKRFRVSYDGKDYVFAYDSELGRYAAIGDEAINIPDNLEAVLSEKLENFKP